MGVEGSFRLLRKYVMTLTWEPRRQLAGGNLLLGERSSFLPQYPSAPLNAYAWSVRLSHFGIWAPISPQHASAAAHARLRMKPRWSDTYPACSSDHVSQIDGVVVNRPLI
jgi:hypothetical protein